MRCRAGGGFTLIEVLVALFVVAIGMVGAAAMQARAQRAHTAAALASGALQVAQSLAERMHANRAAMALPDSSNPYLQLDYHATAGEPAAPLPCFGEAVCDPLQLAAHDLYHAALAVHDMLPGGRIRVCRDASGAPGWECDHAAQAPAVVKLGWDGAASPQVALVAGAAP